MYKLFCQKPVYSYLPKWLCWADLFKCLKYLGCITLNTEPFVLQKLFWASKSAVYNQERFIMACLWYIEQKALLNPRANKHTIFFWTKNDNIYQSGLGAILTFCKPDQRSRLSKLQSIISLKRRNYFILFLPVFA